jgi:hypothetical protein
VLELGRVSDPFVPKVHDFFGQVRIFVELTQIDGLKEKAPPIVSLSGERKVVEKKRAQLTLDEPHRLPRTSTL